jgi:energy-coupling factor transporter transmembrane protein EcfT
MPRRATFALVADSPLRRVDARVKLALGLAASAAVMLPLAPLAIAFAAYTLLLAAGRLLPAAAAPLRRLAPLLVILFALDWLFVDAPFALLITLRLSLLVTAFTILVSTTTPDELRTALERLGLSTRLAFALSSAYRSLAQLEREWRTIEEAQRARGIDPFGGGRPRSHGLRRASPSPLTSPTPLTPSSARSARIEGPSAVAFRRLVPSIRWTAAFLRRSGARFRRQQAPRERRPPGARGRSTAHWRQRLTAVVALVVPAIVLATQRAWSLTEAATVRGLESPHHGRPAPAPLARRDRGILAVAAALLLTLALVR